MKCCICGKEFTGYGNNPWPVKSQGECCDKCNMKVVIPTRLCFNDIVTIQRKRLNGGDDK